MTSAESSGLNPLRRHKFISSHFHQKMRMCRRVCYETAEGLYTDLKKEGLEVIWDDRYASAEENSRMPTCWEYPYVS